MKCYFQISLKLLKLTKDSVLFRHWKRCLWHYFITNREICTLRGLVSQIPLFVTTPYWGQIKKTSYSIKGMATFYFCLKWYLWTRYVTLSHEILSNIVISYFKLCVEIFFVSSHHINFLKRWKPVLVGQKLIFRVKVP